MAQTTAKSYFWLGFGKGLLFLPVIIPFATLFGVVGTEAGLTLVQVTGFSALVIAGSAQFTALQLMAEGAPTVIVILIALAVNLRMAMYSAAMTPHLGMATVWQRMGVSYLLVDQSYAMAILKYEANPQMTLPQKLGYFFGAVAPVAPLWYLFTLVGALVGQALPAWLGLDFAVPLAFIALIAPALTTTAHKAAAFVAVVLGLVFSFIPYSGGLLIAAAAAMATGAEIERRSVQK